MKYILPIVIFSFVLLFNTAAVAQLQEAYERIFDLPDQGVGTVSTEQDSLYWQPFNLHYVWQWGDGGPYYACVAFYDNMLIPYVDDWALTEMFFYIHTNQPTYLDVVVFEGGQITEPNPVDGDEILRMDVLDDVVLGNWNSVVFDEEIVIKQENYWLCIEVGTTGGTWGSTEDNTGVGCPAMIRGIPEDWNCAPHATVGHVNYIIGGILSSLVSVDNGNGLPEKVVLSYNYPNPFNPSTVIEFGIPNDSHVVLTVYDILGREVTTLVDRELHAGSHSVTFEASGLTSGVYFYRLQAGDEVRTHRMILQK